MDIWSSGMIVTWVREVPILILRMPYNLETFMLTLIYFW